jgi:DNA polymerase-3 subunit epsilon
MQSVRSSQKESAANGEQEGATVSIGEVPETPFDSAEFVVVDLETTGTGAHQGSRVTEAAAVLVCGTEVRLLFQSLVNPEIPIPYFITRLTGIDDAMVAGAPTFREIAGELAAHLAGRVFVAHNAAFDWGFLHAEFSRISPGGIEALVPTRLCTVRLARRILRHLPRRNLDAVCAYYGIGNGARHRASGDALATAQVLVRLLKDAERSGYHSIESLTRYARPRAKKRSALPISSDGADGA